MLRVLNAYHRFRSTAWSAWRSTSSRSHRAALRPLISIYAGHRHHARADRTDAGTVAGFLSIGSTARSSTSRIGRRRSACCSARSSSARQGSSRCSSTVFASTLGPAHGRHELRDQAVNFRSESRGGDRVNHLPAARRAVRAREPARRRAQRRHRLRLVNFITIPSVCAHRARPSDGQAPSSAERFEPAQPI